MKIIKFGVEKKGKMVATVEVSVVACFHICVVVSRR